MKADTYAVFLESLIGVRVSITHSDGGMLILNKSGTLYSGNNSFTMGEILHVGDDYVKVLIFKYLRKDDDNRKFHCNHAHEDIVHISKVKFVNPITNSPESFNFPGEINIDRTTILF